MPSSPLPRRFLIAFALACTALVPVAQADGARSGGASFASRPEVKRLECVNGELSKCPEGELLRVRGEGMQHIDTVVFLGSSGRADDERVKPDKRSPHRVLVRVPTGAHSGPVRVVSRVAGASRASRRLRVVAASQSEGQSGGAPPIGEGVFPVRGRHRFGTAINRFGGGRGHEGQDVFARCGTLLVAARSGVVSWTAFHARAGNYVVITADDGTSQAYMHLLRPTIVQRQARVVAGQPIGQVGRTGRATGCHLHYESWTAPGWYRGGRPIDPLPELQQYAARG